MFKKDWKCTGKVESEGSLANCYTSADETDKTWAEEGLRKHHDPRVADLYFPWENSSMSYINFVRIKLTP